MSHPNPPERTPGAQFIYKWVREHGPAPLDPDDIEFIFIDNPERKYGVGGAP